MDNVPGQTLEKLYSSMDASTRKMVEDKVVYVCDTLNAGGIFHNDVRGRNIMIAVDPGSSVMKVVLIDFDFISTKHRSVHETSKHMTSDAALFLDLQQLAYGEDRFVALK
jgi:tRNA A-37 threonylcarbamoyl transferase component Bud32